MSALDHIDAQIASLIEHLKQHGSDPLGQVLAIEDQIDRLRVERVKAWELEQEVQGKEQEAP